MTDKPQVTKEELRRMKAWLICLSDALAYIALARQKDDFIADKAEFRFASGSRAGVRLTIEKGLVAAAIVSAGQIFKSGRHGDYIADNLSQNLIKLRSQLFQCSDIDNGFAKGESEKIFKDKVSYYRDGFVSHFDGKKAEIKLLAEDSDAISWKGPNPWFRADGFQELEKVLYQMYRSLQQYVTEQTLLFRSSMDQK